MPNVERSPIMPPNDKLKTLAEKRSMSPPSSAGQVKGSNMRFAEGDPGGSGPEPKSASPVKTDNHRFNIANAKMPNPPSVEQPGPGAVGVDLRAYSQPATGMAKQDMAGVPNRKA